MRLTAAQKLIGRIAALEAECAAWKKHADDLAYGEPIPTKDCQNFVHITVLKYKENGVDQYGVSVGGMLPVREAIKGAGLAGRRWL